ncbi:MAG: methylated-DNA/protein-cysteine methyltransferase [Nevskia sp.]|nr:methylated-DNA/protein-cysteine methyltransferase [Nevskia sp.]
MSNYRNCETSLGTMLLVANAQGLSGTYFVDQKYFPTIAADWRETANDAVLNDAAAQFKAYFAGKLQHFELPLAAVGTAFQQAVWSAISTVGYGERISYGELARRVGRADSVRAAGTATGRNPLSIIVPCHRIVGADGSLTGYAGGLERKRQLLALEARSAAPLFALEA